MTPRNALLLAVLAFGGVIGWSLQRAHGAWADYQDTRGKVPRARDRLQSRVGSAVRWGLVGIVIVFALLRL